MTSTTTLAAPSVANPNPAWPKGDGARPKPLVSLIVPTKNESGNVPELVRRVAEATAEFPVELIFVDDSSDDTPEVITQVATSSPVQVVLHARGPEERTGGLGGAVTLGMSLASADWICVMDGDLQHPPELLPDMYREALRTGSDVVIASRYVDTGGVGNFSRIRTLLSEGSTSLARLAFPGVLRGVKDPMSGFFLVRRASLDLGVLQPRGFKILFEILCRTPNLRVTEVPFQFGVRLAGESKASLQEGARYLRQVLDLRFGPAWMRFVLFGLVGTTGIAVNAAALAFFTEILGVYYLLSAILATQVSTLWNFTWTESVVFRGTSRTAGRLWRGAMFFAMNNAALGIRGPLLYVLVASLGIHYMLANIISLVSLMVIRFVTADRLIWGRSPAEPGEVAELPVSPASFPAPALATSESIQ